MPTEQNRSKTPMANAEQTMPTDESTSQSASSVGWRKAAHALSRRALALGQGIGRFLGSLSLRLYKLLLTLWQRFNAIQWPRLPFTPLQWIALGFVLGGVLFALLTPPFEIGDEFAHAARVQGQAPQSWGAAAYQPPLYYAVSGFLGGLLDEEALGSYRQHNPYARPFDVFGTANKNLFLRDDRTYWALVLPGLLVLRLLNVAFAALALWPVARIGGLLAPQRPSVALLAAGLLAFNPMVMALSASVNNFALALLSLSLATYAFMRALSWGWAWPTVVLVILSAVLALNVHSAAWLIVPVVVLVGLWVAIRDCAFAPYGVLLLGLGLLVALTLGGWLADNLAQHGDPWALSGITALAGPRPVPLDVVQILDNFSLFRASYWGVFGADNLLASPLFYLLTDMVTFLGLFGLAFMVAQLYAIRDFAQARRELIAVTALLGLALLAMILYGVALASVRHAPPQLMLLFAPAFAPLLAAGLVEVYWWAMFLLMPPERSFVRAGDAVPHEALMPLVRGNWQVLALLALLTPLLTIAPQYQPPVPLTDLPAQVTRVYARYGPIELLGYRVPDRRYLPGERVPISLYWRAIEPTERDYMLSVGLVAPNGEEIGKQDSFPLGGRLRTSQWPPGAVYEDHLEIRLSLLAAGPYPLRFQVSWWDREAQVRIPPQDESRRELSAVVLDAGALVAPFAQNVDIRSVVDLASGSASRPSFEGELRPQIYTFNRRTRLLHLGWEALQPLPENYTFFAHVMSQDGRLMAQDDVHPALPTRYWRTAETVTLTYDLQRRLPPGQYDIIVGVYLWPSLERLTLQDAPVIEPFQIIAESTPVPDPLYVETTYRLFGFSIDENGAFVSSELDAILPEVTPEATVQPEG